MALTNEQRKKLDGVVSAMEAAGESEATILQAVREFKAKYDSPVVEFRNEARPKTEQVETPQLLKDFDNRMQNIKTEYQNPENNFGDKAFVTAGEIAGIPGDAYAALGRLLIPGKVREKVSAGAEKVARVVPGIGEAIDDYRAGTGFFKDGPKMSSEEKRALEYLGNFLALPMATAPIRKGFGVADVAVRKRDPLGWGIAENLLEAVEEYKLYR